MINQEYTSIGENFFNHLYPKKIVYDVIYLEIMEKCGGNLKMGKYEGVIC